MLQKTRDTILLGLEELGLSNLPARPYDCPFELLAAPKTSKKIIIVGFNGSLADMASTNSLSVIDGYENPSFFNVKAGMDGAWGVTHLAKRLYALPVELGFDPNDTIYTNALLMCSKNAWAVKKTAEASTLGSLSALIERSMLFFSKITVALAQPELIIAYSNGKTSHSAARILLNSFGNGDTPDYVSVDPYYSTYGFTSTFGDSKIPVVGIRHLSRFKSANELIKLAWQRQLIKQS